MKKFLDPDQIPYLTEERTVASLMVMPGKLPRPGREQIGVSLLYSSHLQDILFTMLSCLARLD